MNTSTLSMSRATLVAADTLFQSHKPSTRSRLLIVPPGKLLPLSTLCSGLYVTMESRGSLPVIITFSPHLFFSTLSQMNMLVLTVKGTLVTEPTGILEPATSTIYL